MGSINKLQISLCGNSYVAGEFKVKTFVYDVGKETAKTITIRDGIRSVRKSKNEIDIVLVEHRNNTFESISFFCFCEDDKVEFMTEQLVGKVKEQFNYLENIYKSAEKAMSDGLISVLSV